jgi:hypothetical protein
MRLSGLSLAILLLSATVAIAQHGGGGGGGSSAGSSGGGGGSHGGGGGSSSSGGSGSHSSGGGSGHSSSGGGHSSGSHGSAGHSSNAASVTRTGTRNPRNAPHQINEPNRTLQPKPTAEKRTFFSFLRHPFHRPQPKAVVAPHPPLCRKGPCRICPAGKAGRGCIVPGVYTHNECRYPNVWNGGICTLPMPIVDTCSALLREMQRQEQRMQAAQASEQSTCAGGQSQSCSDAVATRQNEEARYQSALNNYRRCRMGGAVSYRFSGSGFPGFEAGLSYDPFRLDLTY